MSHKNSPTGITEAIETLTRAVLQLAPAPQLKKIQLTKANAYYWDAGIPDLVPIERVSTIPLPLLFGINDVRDILKQNTLQFAKGFSANNALLWGARGMGKSSLVKALHDEISANMETGSKRLILIEISREDIASLPLLMRTLSHRDAQFIIFCDDLSFDAEEATYKSLKTILDGGLEGRPRNTIFYATSNRRHLMARDMIENERATSISPGEAVDEKVSLSDRFGLWLGFHNCSQDDFLAMVQGYAAHYGLEVDESELRARAIEWALTRGARSGRVAIQFIRQLAGEKGQAI